jgi:hypothetical protein
MQTIEKQTDRSSALNERQTNPLVSTLAFQQPTLCRNNLNNYACKYK